MIFDARTCKDRGMFVNVETGQVVRWVRMYDTETLEYERFERDPARDPGAPLLRGRARLRFVPAAGCVGNKPADVEPLAEARRRLGVRALVAVAGCECDERGCHALAVWQVADEQEIEPVVGPDGTREERAVTVGKRKYCDRHYRLPTFTSLRGVEAEVEVGARPQ